MTKYKIVKCTSYKSNKEVEREWYEVQYLSNLRKWIRVWKTFKDKMYSSGGPFYVNLEFDDEEKAREFINKCESNVPSDKVVRKPVWELIG